MMKSLNINPIQSDVIKSIENKIKSDDCLICMQTFNYSQLDDNFKLGCGDVICQNCIVENITQIIKNGNVLDIKCPISDCPFRLNDQKIKEIVPDNYLIEKFKKFLILRMIEKDKSSDLIICPFPNCNSYLLKKGKRSDCENKHIFCSKCMQPWHHGECREDESSEWMKKYNSHNKKCPRCFCWIEYKDKGFITCSGCKLEFCWNCLDQFYGGEYQWCREYTYKKKDAAAEYIELLQGDFPGNMNLRNMMISNTGSLLYNYFYMFSISENSYDRNSHIYQNIVFYLKALLFTLIFNPFCSFSIYKNMIYSRRHKLGGQYQGIYNYFMNSTLWIIWFFTKLSILSGFLFFFFGILNSLVINIGSKENIIYEQSNHVSNIKINDNLSENIIRILEDHNRNNGLGRDIGL